MEGLFDLCVGTGGSPEGVATACAIKALGGVIQARLAPQSDDERQRGLDAGLKFDHVYEADELVTSDNTFFVATGVTDGNLVSGFVAADTSSGLRASFCGRTRARSGA